MFGLFTQAAEHALSVREMEAAAARYRGIGTAESEPPGGLNPLFSYTPGNDSYTHSYTPLTREQINAISALPYVTYTDARLMTAGISDKYLRLGEGNRVPGYSQRCVIEGTLGEVNTDASLLMLEDCAVLAGDLFRPAEIGRVSIRYYPGGGFGGGGFGAGGPGSGGPGGDSGGRQSLTYDNEFMRTELAVGGRYAFVVQAERRSFNSSKTASLAGDPAEPWCGLITRVDGFAGDYLADDVYEPLRTLIQIIENDLRSFDVVYTTDMGSIMSFCNGDMGLREGRLLTPGDDSAAAHVCVVSDDFAKSFGVGVGDSINLALCSALFEQYYGLGALAVIPPRYSAPGEAADYEIVGVYAYTGERNKRALEPNHSYSTNTIFIPGSLYAAQSGGLSGHLFTPAEFSFVIADALDIPAFIAEAEPALASMGLSLVFSDNGWQKIAQEFKESARLAIIKIVAFAAAIAFSAGFAAYLFIMRKKSEFAVMRALGTTVRTSSAALLFPLAVITAGAALAGVCAGWLYAAQGLGFSGAATDSGTGVSAGDVAAVGAATASGAARPLAIAFYCAASALLVTLLIARILLARIGKMAPLALLHGGLSKKARPGAGAAGGAGVAAATARSAAGDRTKLPRSQLTFKPTKAHASFGFILRYSARHIRRAARKSALTALLAAVLFAVTGQITIMRRSYDDLIENTVITASFVGGARLSILPMLMESGYVRDPYYNVTTSVDLNSIASEMIVTNNISRFAEEEVAVTYADGFDSSCFDELDGVAVIGKDLAELLGLAPGDYVRITPMGLEARSTAYTINTYTMMYAAYPEVDWTDRALADIARSVERQADRFFVAGVATSPSGRFDGSAFTPGKLDTAALVPAQSLLNAAEYTLNDNMLTEEFREFSKLGVRGISAGRVSLIMDTSKLENLINTRNLLETLEPIVTAAAICLGVFFCCLSVLSSSKEAATMRALGTARAATGALLSLEYAFLCAAGLLVTGCVFAAIGGRAASAAPRGFYLYPAVYFTAVAVSAVVCSLAIIRRDTLGLLRARE
ncbi:MAG: hypothetical protein FWG48_00565 [Oscillospiraceae bacterium]|nr:hypothetical protein [Oscillospiraceae bacterium]